MKRLQRFIAALSCMSVVALIFPTASPAAPSHSVLRYSPFGSVAMRTFKFSDGRYLKVDRSGYGTLYDADNKIIQARWVPATALPEGPSYTQSYQEQLAKLDDILRRPLSKAPFAADHIIVVFKDGTAPAQDALTIPVSTLDTLRKAKPESLMSVAPAYTNDPRVNAAFAGIGVSHVQRMFASFGRSQLSMLHSNAQARVGRSILNVANAYRVTLSNAPVLEAVRSLRTQSGIAYVTPDWAVTTMNSTPHALPESARRDLRTASAARIRSATRARSAGVAQFDSGTGMPANFSVASSLQSMLNSSNLDAVSAYQEIQQQFHQLPGTGETITNVSVGDVFSVEDGGGVMTPSNWCPYAANIEGPTTHTIGGQRYIDWPGMPLIPAYAADANGHTDPSYVACGESPLDEVGLDFSMMAPLPDELQRPGEQSPQVLGDLLGIAPGANYRLFVPATNVPGGGNFLSVIDGTLMAAANMMPKTDVITASLGEGFDAGGFPGRYLEDDPLTEAVIATLVNAYNIVVCISANDGMRSFTPTSIGPSGGSAATNVTTDVAHTTNLNDLPFSTIPSLDVDSGAIDVGGTTLNDIFARPITDPQNASFISQLAYPETRYDGGQYLSSGFGSRVNISAPADNVVALSKVGKAYDAVDIFSEGGTSASAPEVAAAAAVVMQVARLTGHPFASAVGVRKFLTDTATPVAQTPQTDQPLNVGPQLNLRRSVEQLFANASVHINPSVNRVAIFQRRSVLPLMLHGSLFFTNTDPTAIKLEGTDYGDNNGPDGSGNTDPITIAPDWKGIPADASYALYVTGHPDKVLATTPYARLMPETLLVAAGLPLAAPATRTLHLTYRAGSGLHAFAQTSFELTFGPSDGTSVEALPLSAPPVVTGAAFQVSYDISKTRNMTTNPMLVVTEPGRFASSSSFVLHMIYSQPLSASAGTITVPVSALQGAGLYGVGILASDGHTQFITDFATVRVQQASAARAAAPVVQVAGSNEPYAHMLEFPYTSTLNLKWDVSAVPNANGALLEVSAPGPTLANLLNTFNNPNGSLPDNDGVNTGSVKVIPLSGVSGNQNFKVKDLGLNAAMLAQIRVLPVNGQNAVGEASDVSTLIPDGIRGALGGWLDATTEVYGGGFAINPYGNDAFVVDTLALAGGQFETAIDLFDQTTGTTQIATGAFTYGPFGLLGGAYYANGTAFFAKNAHPQDQANAEYDTISTTTSHVQYGFPIRMPSSTDQIIGTSFNPESSSMAYLYMDGTLRPGTAVPHLRTYDFSRRTFGPALNTPLSGRFYNGPFLFNADMALNKGILGRSIFTDFTGRHPEYLDLIDLQTGAMQEYASQTAGIIAGMAVDAGTHMAMTGSAADNAVVLFNMQTGGQRKVFLPYDLDAGNLGWTGGLQPFDAEFLAADPVNHLFLVYARWGPGIATADYNATSPLYVFDETGNLVKTVTGWAWASDAGHVTDNGTAYLQANGNTRKAYLMMGTEIAVIDY